MEATKPNATSMRLFSTVVGGHFEPARHAQLLVACCGPMQVIVALLLSFVAVGCSPAYTYMPAANATATIDGRSAADYPIPPEQPRGDLRIASFGFADLTPNGTPDDEEHALHALHVRVIVANNEDHEWTLDTREQRVDLQGRGKSAPAFASANAGSSPPLVTIPAGGKRVIDLFFPLPSDQQRASKIPEFDAIWTVHTPARTVTDRTPFDRVMLAPAPSPYDYGGDYWGPPYWYDPGYSNAAFIGAEPLGLGYVGGPIVIHSHGAPRGHR